MFVNERPDLVRSDGLAEIVSANQRANSLLVVEHQHIKNRQPGNELIAELPVLDQTGFDEFQLNALCAEVVPVIQRLTVRGVDVGAAIKGSANRDESIRFFEARGFRTRDG